jgi:predicted ribosome quality control (RQC) complex YloA/Tae2 family protein
MNLPNKVRIQMEKIAALRREKQQLINNKEKEVEKIKNRFEKKIEKLDEKILNEQIKLDELLAKFNNNEPKKPDAKVENNKTNPSSFQ